MRFFVQATGGVLFAFALLACDPPESPFSPASWGEGEIERYAALGSRPGSESPLESADSVMVAALSHPLAVRAGLEALRQGGSAADAVLTVALTDVVVTQGSGVSFAGEMVLTYFDADSGQVASLDATYGTVAAERDPLSILPEKPGGRSALVPGYMAGVQAIHDRFGRLAFADLFVPAIFFAEQGVVLDQYLADRIRSREEIVTRLPEGRRVFQRPDGSLFEPGDTLRQPEAALTLGNVAEQGADYIYRGDWARHLVAAVQSDGGKLSLSDMEGYQAIWTEPVQGAYRGYDVFGPGLPTYGGINTVEALLLAEELDLSSMGDIRTSPEALYWLIRIAQVADLLSPPLVGHPVPSGLIATALGESFLDPHFRVRPEAAAQLAEAMRQSEWDQLTRDAALARLDSAASASLLRSWGQTAPTHTSIVTAVDGRGNVAVLMHSVNASLFGDGIFVDGFAIPNPGAYIQPLLATLEPGEHTPLWDNTIIVLKDGEPVFACAGKGAAYHEVNVQNLLTMMDFGLDPRTAAHRPQLRKQWPYGMPVRLPVGGDSFLQATVEAVNRMGLDVEAVTDPSAASPGGGWMGVKIDPISGTIQAGFGPLGISYAEGDTRH